jgi:uncharacterized membrane protein YecN with MAPEG domain
MTTTMTTAVVCTAVLGALVFALGANVTRHRAIRGKNGGPQASTDPSDRLLIAIRAHGNASEYVPTLVVLFILVAWQSPGWWSTTLVVAATASRIVHASGMLASTSLASPTIPREAAAAGTYLFGLALAVTTAVAVV